MSVFYIIQKLIEYKSSTIDKLETAITGLALRIKSCLAILLTNRTSIGHMVLLIMFKIDPLHLYTCTHLYVQTTVINFLGKELYRKYGVIDRLFYLR